MANYDSSQWQEDRVVAMTDLAAREGWTANELRLATTGDIYDQIAAETAASLAAAERNQSLQEETSRAPQLDNCWVTRPTSISNTVLPIPPVTAPPIPDSCEPASNTISPIPTATSSSIPTISVVAGSYGLFNEFGQEFDCECALIDEHLGRYGMDGSLMMANMHTWLGRRPPEPIVDDSMGSCCDCNCGTTPTTPTPTPPTPTPPTPTPPTPTPPTPEPEPEPPPEEPPTPPTPPSTRRIPVALVFNRTGMVTGCSYITESLLTPAYIDQYSRSGYTMYEVETCVGMSSSFTRETIDDVGYIRRITP